MKRLVGMLLILIACGCSQPAAPAAKKKAAAKPAPARTDPASLPKAPAKQPVPADAYAGVDEAVQALGKAAIDSDRDVMLRADEWLVTQGAAAAGPLGRVLNDEQAHPAARIAATRTLRQLGPAGKPPLLQALQAQSEQIQLNAIKGLGAIKPPDDEIIATITGLLDSTADRVRREAVFALANIGPAAKEAATEKLIAILNNPQENDTLRAAAKDALQKVNPRRTFMD
jgi:HEAT repeat protein